MYLPGLIGAFLFLVQLQPDFPVYQIQNGSFEAGPSGCCQVPPDWQNCGNSDETPPDIHCDHCPDLFGVSMPVPHGEQFLALVVRSNGSRECLQQEFAYPLPADSTFFLRFSLGRADTYDSVDRITGEPASYGESAGLAVYTMSATGFVREVGRIYPFRQYDWTEYYLRIRPEQEVAALLIEAVWLPEHSPYNGHILIDHLRLEDIPGP